MIPPSRCFPPRIWSGSCSRCVGRFLNLIFSFFFWDDDVAGEEKRNMDVVDETMCMHAQIPPRVQDLHSGSVDVLSQCGGVNGLANRWVLHVYIFFAHTDALQPNSSTTVKGTVAGRRKQRQGTANTDGERRQNKTNETVMRHTTNDSNAKATGVSMTNANEARNAATKQQVGNGARRRDERSGAGEGTMRPCAQQ